MNSAAMAATISGINALAEQNAPRESEYIGADGLIYCKDCGEARQIIITPPFPGAQPRAVRCVCSCYQRHEERIKARARREEIARRRRVCFHGAVVMEGWTFENDSGKKPELSKAAAQYAEQFKQHYKSGSGLLLWGPVGTGKSYISACIANAVLDKGYTARMTNFEEVARDMQSTWEKQAYIDSLLDYDLLVLDDLGAERQNEFMQAQVFSLIDARYRSGRPMIITTNLTSDELTKTAGVKYSRIYDRVLERCTPIKVDGYNYRRQSAAETWPEMRRQLGMEGSK